MAPRDAAAAQAELSTLQEAMRACQRCRKAGYGIVPGAIFQGEAGARVMLVGQAPGASELAANRPFCGPAGRRLFRWLERAGFGEDEFRKRHYIAAVTRCYPGRRSSGRGDRAPSREEQALCRPYLDAELELVSPELILPVGRLAIRAFLGAKALNEVVGTVSQDEHGRWIVPFPHPSGASRWFNAPENAAHVDRAIRQLARLRRQLAL
ncbi:MAG: uracil-DNA glycosylase family protein [Myxococcota bacterium]